MKAEHAEEYTQALGQIVAGGWRQIALGERLGVPKALGLTTPEWVNRLGGYVKLSVEERHGAVKELKEQGLPNTKIAEVLGVDEKTVRNTASEKSEPKQLKPASLLDGESEKSEPIDAIAALAVEKANDKQAKRRERDEALREEREAQEAEAREALAELGEAACRIEVADIRTWRPLGVSCIITDPPYITDDAVELHSALADFAVEVLPTHGALAVMTWQPILPAVLQAMQRPNLVYRWTAAWTFATSERTPERGPRIFDGWKPIVVFHKDGWTDETTYLYDVIASRDADKTFHEWGQSVDGFRQLVRAFSDAGQIVCDPFVGGGTTAAAALAEQRMFVGCDTDEAAKRITEERLAA